MPVRYLGLIRAPARVLGAIIVAILLCVFAAERVPRFGLFMKRTFGTLYVDVYSNGRISLIEYQRWPVISTHGGVACLHVVAGRYYDAEGRLASVVRNGHGIRAVFHTNRAPRHISFYANGILSGPAVTWYDNGQIRATWNYDDEGAPHGESLGWYRDGNKKYEATYSHGGKLTGVDWYPSGVVRQRFHWGTNGTCVIEQYDSSGVVTQRLVL